MKPKLNLKKAFHKVSEWSKMKWCWVTFWLFTGILLIVIIVLLVVFQNSKEHVIEDAIASVSFAFLTFLILAIFIQIIDIYQRKKAARYSGEGLSSKNASSK